MGAAFLITLREGFEISLVLAILATYLVRTGRSAAIRQIWVGTGIAVGLCLVIGIVVNSLVGGLHGKAEQAVEGSIALAACGAEGAPHAPAATPANGISITGTASMGVVVTN